MRTIYDEKVDYKNNLWKEKGFEFKAAYEQNNAL